MLETIGWGYTERSLRVLRPDRLLVTIVERKNMELAHKARSAGKRFAGVIVEPDHDGLEALSALVQSGKYRCTWSMCFDSQRSPRPTGS